MKLGCGCGALFVGMAMLWGGGQGVYTALTNREPARMTCAEYVSERPTATWIALTECELAIEESMYETRLGSDEPRKAFVPVRPVDAPYDAPIALVLSTEDEAVLDVLHEALAFEQRSRTAETQAQLLASDPGYAKYMEGRAAPEPPDFLTWYVDNAERLRPTRSVSGLVAFGIELDAEEREQIASLGEGLAEDFVLVADGEQPAMLFSAVMATLGSVALALGALGLFGGILRPRG